MAQSFFTRFKTYLTGKPHYDKMGIAAAAEAIVERTLERLKTTEKLILAVGEDHSSDAHELVQSKIIASLAKENIPMSFAVELNAEEVMLQFLMMSTNFTDEGTMRFVSKILCDADENGHLSGSLAMLYKNEYGNKWHNASLHTAIEHELPIVFVDAASTPKGKEASKVDLGHDATRSVAKMLGYANVSEKYGVSLNSTSAWGLHLRNVFMLQTIAAIPALKEPGPHVVVLKTGAIHVAGAASQDKTTTAPYWQSLSALSREQEPPFQGVIMVTDKGAHILHGGKDKDLMRLCLPANNAISQRDVDALGLDLSQETILDHTKKLANSAVDSMSNVVGTLGKFVKAKTDPALTPK